MEPLLRLEKQYLSDTFKEPIELALSTSSSMVLFFADRVLKLKLDDNGKDRRQAEKTKRILHSQGVLIDHGNMTVQGYRLRTMSLTRFDFSSCYATKIMAGGGPSISSVLKSIRALEDCYESEQVPLMTFELGVAKNISIQLEWAKQNLSESLYEKILESLNRQWQRAGLFAQGGNNIDCFVCHGDLNAGNIYCDKDRIVVLDPCESDIVFSRVPLWADYAGLGASVLLLQRKDLYNEITSYLEEYYDDYNESFFWIWSFIKLIARLRFETVFIGLNHEYDEHIALKWRKYIISRRFETLDQLLEEAPTRNALLGFAGPNSVRLDTLKLMNQTIEGRRNELNAKANVYIVVSVALVAGNAAFLSQMKTGLTLASAAFFLSSFLTLFSLWSFLGLIKHLPSTVASMKRHGRLLFFDWVAKAKSKQLALELSNISEEDLSNELLQQVQSLSSNLRFRYTLQAKALRLLSYAMVVFLYGVCEKVLDISGLMFQVAVKLSTFLNNTLNMIYGLFL